MHFLHVNTFLMKGHSMSEQNRRRYLANIDSILDCSCTFLRKDIKKKLLRFGFSFIFFLNISFEQENIKHLGYRIIKPFTNYSLIQKQRVGKIFRTNTKNIIFFTSIKLVGVSNTYYGWHRFEANSVKKQLVYIISVKYCQ